MRLHLSVPNRATQYRMVFLPVGLLAQLLSAGNRTNATQTLQLARITAEHVSKKVRFLIFVSSWPANVLMNEERKLRDLCWNERT